jgi:hypothetical protein
LTDFLQRVADDFRAQTHSGECAWSGLVTPGETLFSAAFVKGLHLVLGEGLALSANNTNCLAARHGFPLVTAMAQAANEAAAQSQNAPSVSLTISILPLVSISDDGLAARLNLLPPEDGATLPDFLELTARIRESGVVYGLKNDELRRLYDEVSRNAVAARNQLIAFADAATPGEDASLRMEVEVGAIPGKLLDDGRIDFRERRIFVAVKKDQLLAVKVSATRGRGGKDVRGEEIPARDGVDIEVKTADLCVFHPESGEIRATEAGILSVVGASFRVSAKQDISGDVDFSTGNIRFQGNVEITGSIQPGFIVASRGDIKIGGDVQSATVKSHGNVVIAGGVVGESSDVRAEGDIDLKFIERGKATSGGSIRIRGGAYHSDMTAEGDIQGGPDSRFVGGEIRCGGSITVGVVGSATAANTVLAAGLHLRRYRRYLEIIERREELARALDKLIQHRGERNLNCDAYIDLQEELAEADRALAALDLGRGGPHPAEIRVTRELRAGAHLRIGNAALVVESDYAASRIYQDEADGPVLIAPLKTR